MTETGNVTTPLYRGPNAVALPPEVYAEYVLLRALFAEPLVRNPNALADYEWTWKTAGALGLHALMHWMCGSDVHRSRAWEYHQLDHDGCYPEGEAYAPGVWVGRQPVDATAYAMREALLWHIDHLRACLIDAYTEVHHGG